MLRPVFNFSYGHVESEVSAQRPSRNGRRARFPADGHLDAYGLGGSLMLDYEHDRPEHEIDVELRYTNIYLQSYGGIRRR